MNVFSILLLFAYAPLCDVNSNLLLVKDAGSNYDVDDDLSVFPYLKFALFYLWLLYILSSW